MANTSSSISNSVSRISNIVILVLNNPSPALDMVTKATDAHKCVKKQVSHFLQATKALRESRGIVLLCF
jgi:hypothetical protein